MFRMGDNGKGELLSRYEKMLRGEAGYYFDAEEFDEIASEYEDSGSLENALRAVENGLRFHPDSDMLLAKHACYMLSFGRTEEARESVSRVNVDNEESYSAKIELLFNDGNVGEGISLMKQWLDMPDITTDRCLDALDLCVDFNVDRLPLSMILDAAGRLPSAQRLDLFNEFICVMEESGYAKDRYAVYEKILDMEPLSQKYWKEASLAYMDAGRFAKAIEAADYAAALSPDDAGLLFNKAYCLYEAGDYTGAARIISANLSRIEDKSYPYEVLAECFSNMGDYSKSDDVLDIAQEIYPDNARFWYIRAKNRFLADNSGYAKCIEFLKRALRLSPDDISVSLLLAETYSDMGNFSDARAVLGRLVDLNVAGTAVYTLLGDVELKAGFPDIAIGYYRKALAIENDNVEVYVRLIYAYCAVEDMDSMNLAIKRLNELIDKVPDNDGTGCGKPAGMENIRKTVEQIKSMLGSCLDD